MKAQKLGLVLGVNMAVACLMLQGCKATRPGAGSEYPSPVIDPVVTTTEPVPAEPAPAPTVTIAKVEPEPQPVVTEPIPTKVATVKPMPPPPPKHTDKPVVAPAAPAAAEAGFVYVVKSGDQLSAVSRRYNVKLAAIERANPGLNPNKIRVGQKITIPGVTAPAEAVVAGKAAPKDSKVVQASAPAPTAANTVAPVKTKDAFKAYTGATKEYKVRNGDSLGRIAQDNGISIRALKEMNKLTKDSLRIGQTILIPAEKVVAEKKPAADKPGAKPAEKKAEPADKKAASAKPAEKKDAAATVPAEKDASASVPAPAPAETPVKQDVSAAPADVPVADAAAANATDAGKDAAGQSAAEEPKAAPAPAPATGATHTVKEGEDIISVAISWGISPSQLIDFNNIKQGEAIKPGQVLKLPANAKQNVQ